MKVTIEKKTDQLNYEDFLGGVTRTVTIAGVKKGTKEQQYDIAIEGDQRVWRPAVTVLKLLVEAWTDEAATWVGRRVTLYGDPTVMFGREKVGGIRVSHMSDLPGGTAMEVSLTETRGRRRTHKVLPLIDDAPAPTEPAPLTPIELAEQVASGLRDATTEEDVNLWAGRAHARNLLDLSPAGSEGTLRELVQTRLDQLGAGAGGVEGS